MTSMTAVSRSHYNCQERDRDHSAGSRWKSQIAQGYRV